MKNPFTPCSKYYRCICHETCEEQIFDSLKDAKRWSQNVVDTFGHQMAFTLILVRESETKYKLDTFAREVPL